MLKPHRQKIILSSKSLARDKAGALKHLDESLAALKTTTWTSGTCTQAAGRGLHGRPARSEAIAKKQGRSGSRA